jgi:hypothetical protein
MEILQATDLLKGVAELHGDLYHCRDRHKGHAGQRGGDGKPGFGTPKLGTTGGKLGKIIIFHRNAGVNWGKSSSKVGLGV